MLGVVFTILFRLRYNTQTCINLLGIILLIPSPRIPRVRNGTTPKGIASLSNNGSNNAWRNSTEVSFSVEGCSPQFPPPPLTFKLRLLSLLFFICNVRQVIYNDSENAGVFSLEVSTPSRFVEPIRHTRGLFDIPLHFHIAATLYIRTVFQNFNAFPAGGLPHPFLVFYLHRVLPHL